MDVDEAKQRIQEDLDERLEDLEQDKQELRKARQHARETGDYSQLRELVG